MSNQTLHQLLNDLKSHLETKETLNVAELLEEFHERGFGFFLFLLALPAALPLPAIGYGTVLAMPLIFLTTQIVLGRETVWLPEKLKQKNFSANMLAKTIEKALPWISRLEYWLHPRLEFMTQSVFLRLTGLAGLLMACSVLLPFPLTNTVPSLGIALIGAGLFMRDGLAILAGILTGLLWIALLTGLTLYFGAQGVELFKEFIKGFF